LEASRAGEVLLEWREELEDDRGARAALRRAQTSDDVIMEPAFHRLRNHPDWPAAIPFDAAASIAIAVAQTDVAAPPPDHRLGAALAIGQKRVSPARLRLLASAEIPQQFLRLLRGALAQIDGRAPVLDLAEKIRLWHRPASRPGARRDLLVDYFAAVPAAMLSKEA
jgi:CRISPR system Cascade subunit CasB